MNWVGGSRRRHMVKDHVQKQREFFEKNRMQQRMKKLGLPLGAEAKGTSLSGNMDLVSLFIANQISAKKENRDPPKIRPLGGPKGGLGSIGNVPLELPMSPCSPSRLNLVESQPRYSVQGIRKRKHGFPGEIKSRQLSPVLESAFSDNSASDYKPQTADATSPFSSSSVSSGEGLFTLQPNPRRGGQTQAPLRCRSAPLHWDTPVPERAEFIPFSQSGGMSECVPWFSEPNTPQCEPETPAMVRALFHSTEPESTKAGDPMRHGDGFSLNHSESKELMLGFTLDQSEAEKQIELELFSGLGNEEYGSEAGHFWETQSKIFLREETQKTRNTIGSQNRGLESDSLTQLPIGTDVNSPCPGHTSGPCVESEESAPSCCLSGDYLSSASDDDEGESQGCLLPVSSYPAQGVTETLNPNEWTLQHRPVTPQMSWPGNSRDQQRALESHSYPNSAYVERDRQGDRQTEGSYKAQSSYPRRLRLNIQQSKAAPTETQDIGTQTTNILARQISNASTQCSLIPEPTKNPIAAQQTFDASTQCSLIPEPTKGPLEFVVYNSPVDISTPNPATRGQAGHRDAAVWQETHSASWTSYRRREEHTVWTISSREYMPGRVATQTDAQCSQTTDQERSKRNEGAFDENASLSKDLPENERENVTSTSESRVSGFSDETETLQDIVGTLLHMLKRRKQDGR